MSALKPSTKVLILFGILIIPSVAYLLVSSGKNNFSHLEYYGPKEPVAGHPGDTTYHSIAPFELISQDGIPVTADNLEGKIYVANFFFATCQTVCPKMSMQMKRVQEATKDDDHVALVSHTINPDHDSVAVLSAYAKEYGAISGKWYLLTGDKKQIYDLARSSYFIAAMPVDTAKRGGPDDFIHSEQLILVDKKKHIRGYYDGTDYADVDRLVDEIKVLEWEEKH